MKLGNQVAYVMKVLQERGIYKRVYLQKVLYLTFLRLKDQSQGLFQPTRTGMYSRAVQRMAQYLEQHPDIVNQWFDKCSEDFRGIVHRIVEWIVTHNISQEEIIRYSKLVYLEKSSRQNEDKLAKAEILGWMDVKNCYTESTVLCEL